MKILTVVLVVLSLGLGVWGFQQRQVNRELRLLAKELEATLADQSAALAEAERQAGKRATDLEMAQAEVAALKSGPSAATAGPPAAGGKQGETGKDFFKSMAKMMEDPAMKEMIAQQQSVVIDGMFGDFFRELNLPPEQEDAFRQLLIDKQMAATQIGMKMMNAGAEERLAISKEFQEETKRIKEEMKGVLGDEAYESYELFEQSQPERQQLTAYKQSLVGRGLELDYDTEQELMTAMYETRTNFKFSKDFGTEQEPNPEAWAGISTEVMDRHLAEYRQLQDQVNQRAQTILSQEQFEAFRETQEGLARMQEMGMRMGMSMMAEDKE